MCAETSSEVLQLMKELGMAGEIVQDVEAYLIRRSSVKQAQASADVCNDLNWDLHPVMEQSPVAG